MLSTVDENEETKHLVDDEKTVCDSGEWDRQALLAHKHSFTSLWFRFVAISLAITILVSACFIGFRVSQRHAHDISVLELDMTPEEASPCGDNPITARERGCEFDPLTFAWLTPECYDYNLTAEFLKLQDWQWWRVKPDGSRRQLSLINIMQSSDETLHVSWEYHRQHCAYLWIKMHRAMLSGSPIDGVTMLDIITNVCDGVFRSKRDLNDTSVPGYIRFPSCKTYLGLDS